MSVNARTDREAKRGVRGGSVGSALGMGWLTMRLLLIVTLALAVFGSAVSVVYVKYVSRKFFVELQSLERERDIMNVEWGQLQLEQSTWATHDRIERIARSRLGLFTPPAEAVVLVRP